MEVDLTLEKKLFDFIKEDELSFLQNPMNQIRHKLDVSENNESFNVTEIQIHDKETFVELFTHNNNTILILLHKLSIDNRYNLFILYRDWNFLYTLFIKENMTTDNIGELFGTIYTFILSNEKSLVAFFVETNNDSYTDLLLDTTFAVFVALFHDDGDNKETKNLHDKIKLYQKSLAELKQVKIDTKTQEMIRSLIYIQKHIIYREIEDILKSINNSGNVNSLRTRISELEYQLETLLKEKSHGEKTQQQLQEEIAHQTNGNIHSMTTCINELELQLQNLLNEKSQSEMIQQQLQEEIERQKTNLQMYENRLRSYDDPMMLLTGKLTGKRTRLNKTEENIIEEKNMNEG